MAMDQDVPLDGHRSGTENLHLTALPAVLDRSREDRSMAIAGKEVAFPPTMSP
jgi:hypothetical protein